MSGGRPHRTIALLVVVWLATVGAGIALVTRYKGTPGQSAEAAPERWPTGSLIARSTDRPTLVMLAHPRCSCTRASIGELAELMQRVGDRVSAYVLVMQPQGLDPGWSDTDVSRGAGAIPGVHVIRDADGLEARRFGAETSGQTLVYDATGRLVFRGGITPARGHAGNSVGRDRIAALILAGNASASAPVFGCALNDPAPGRDLP